MIYASRYWVYGRCPGRIGGKPGPTLSNEAYSPAVSNAAEFDTTTKTIRREILTYVPMIQRLYVSVLLC